MLPYLHTDLVNMFKSVLKLVIKGEFIDGCTSSSMLTKIDFEKDANFKRNKDCYLGFSTQLILSDLKKRDMVNGKSIRNFYEGVRKCVVKTMQ